MYEILLLHDLNPGKLRKQFDRTLDELAAGNFTIAEVKKMSGTGFYRARLDLENRLLFRFGRYEDRTVLMILELILNHDYSNSRFLRGAVVDESKLVAIPDNFQNPDQETVRLAYINKRYPKFHLLDKFLSFDDNQEEILNHPLPQIIIGSAGSGKTALTLEKVKTLTGRVLYVTLSAYLAENSSHWYFANNFENGKQEVDFLSYRELVETIRIPEGKEMDFRTFNSWFSGYRQSTKLKDVNKVFEEFRGVITGLDISKEYLTREDYLALGVKQSIFPVYERETVYSLFGKYLLLLEENGLFDGNIYSYQLQKECRREYDFIVVDEVQDFTNVQLNLILKSLKRQGNFILCGDANQVVHPNFFSWSNLKSMFYQNNLKGDEIRILHANYRNSPVISELANRLLKIKTARFGSLDKESNYLVSTVSKTEGEMVLLEEKDRTVHELSSKTRRSVNYAVLVLRNEDKAKAGKMFPSPLLFSVQESKGLEYENIILHNFISGSAAEFDSICEGVTAEDLATDDLVYARGRDKSDKSLDAYKFYINALYVAITRAVKNVYIVEQARGHKLIRLMGISEEIRNRVIREEVSSSDDWKRESRRLEMMGKSEQAEAIRKNILVTVKPSWEPLTVERYTALKNEALDPEHFNKKAKDQLFDFALIHNQILIMEKLAGLNYRRAEKYETESGSILRKYYPNYRDDNLKMVIQEVNKYGIDYRDIHNFTPLHAAAFSGAVKVTEFLLRSGADPVLADTFYKIPVQIALMQAFVNKDYAKNKLGRIYPYLLTSSLSLQVDGHLIKIDPYKVEFMLVHLFIAVQSAIQQSKLSHQTIGIQVDDFIDKLQDFPGNVLQGYRKKRQYWLSILAKHETIGNNPYNKKLFRRVGRGVYILNPILQVRYGDEWIPAHEIINSQGISLEEIFNHSLDKHNKEFEEFRRQWEKDSQKRAREEMMRQKRREWF